MRLLLAPLLLSLAGVSPALSLEEACGPPATYTAVVKLVPLRLTETLSREGGRCVYRSQLGTRGWAAWKTDTITETSEFTVVDGRLVPLHYAKRDEFSSKDRDIVTRFGTNGEVVSLYRGEEIRHEAAGAVYDLLSLRRALGLDLAAGRLASSYRIVDGKGRLKEVAVTSSGTETVTTRAGRFEAVRLEYGTGGDRFVVWAAPALGYRFARVEQYDDGELRGRLELETWGG